MTRLPLIALAFVAAPLLAIQGGAADAVPTDPFAVVDVPPAKLVLPQRPNEAAIRQAIRDTLAESKDQLSSANGSALSGDAYRAFARQFSDAKKAHCLGEDRLKHQQHTIETKDWTFGVSDAFEAPFWVAAVVRGKCKWLP